jgi:hypothetical protein
MSTIEVRAERTARPPCPEFAKPHPRPAPFAASLRRFARRSILSAIDSGWLGLQALQQHVVVCGFPRSGSTMLQAMIEACVVGARTFRDERPALDAARRALRNHRLMVTKDPWDVFYVDEIRDFYSSRRATVQFVLTNRDPRAVLTSFFEDSTEYYVPPDWWRAHRDHFQYARSFADVLCIEYADLVSSPASVERQLTERIGWKLRERFANFHQALPKDFNTVGLNGLRPPDPSTAAKWRHPRHRERLRQVLGEIPDLPDYLIEAGYETDARWVDDYR